jgi:hypothetical protein
VKEHEHFRQDDCRKCYGRDRFVLGSVTATEATVADRIAQPGPRLSRRVRTHQHSTLARLTMRLVTMTLYRSRAPWWSKHIASTLFHGFLLHSSDCPLASRTVISATGIQGSFRLLRKMTGDDGGNIQGGSLQNRFGSLAKVIPPREVTHRSGRKRMITNRKLATPWQQNFKLRFVASQMATRIWRKNRA